MKHIHGKTTTLSNVGEDRTLSPIYEASHQLQHYLAPLELEEAIDEWVQYYNEQRYHESLSNLRPIDVSLGRPEQILKIREQLKRDSLNQRYQAN